MYYMFSLIKFNQMRLPIIASQYELQKSGPVFAQFSYPEKTKTIVDMQYASRLDNTLTKSMEHPDRLFSGYMTRKSVYIASILKNQLYTDNYWIRYLVNASRSMAIECV